MRLDDLERDLFDKLTDENKMLKREIEKLKQDIINRHKVMLEYELRRDKILFEIIPAPLFCDYAQKLSKSKI